MESICNPKKQKKQKKKKEGKSACVIYEVYDKGQDKHEVWEPTKFWPTMHVVYIVVPMHVHLHTYSKCLLIMLKIRVLSTVLLYNWCMQDWSGFWQGNIWTPTWGILDKKASRTSKQEDRRRIKLKSVDGVLMLCCIHANKMLGLLIYIFRYHYMD